MSLKLPVKAQFVTFNLPLPENRSPPPSSLAKLPVNLQSARFKSPADDPEASAVVRRQAVADRHSANRRFLNLGAEKVEYPIEAR